MRTCGEAEGDRAPNCPFCGVTALPSERADGDFVCENPDCTAYGDVITP